jgi:hypothetical protein
MFCSAPAAWVVETTLKAFAGEGGNAVTEVFVCNRHMELHEIGRTPLPIVERLAARKDKP